MKDNTDYPYLFDEWLKSEHEKMRSRSKGFVGDRPYRHFDGRVDWESLDSNQSKIIPKLKDPGLLSGHSFYPFIRKDQKVRLFGAKSIGQKVRPIMYASHNDACIFSFYAFILKQLYEEEIKDTPLNSSVIAYRRVIREDNPDKGKSNIDLAKDALELTRRYKKCAVLCLDVEKFFDRMNHELIYKKWCGLISCEKMPQGHYAVFQNATRFRYVFLHEALSRLGYGHTRKGKFIYKKGYRKSGPLCYPKEFNSKIDANKNSIVHKNRSSIGIPQGSPISDIIANLYLKDFDSRVLDFISGFTFSHYRRYSDDILIICPEEKVSEVYSYILQEIQEEKLKIKQKKTEALILDMQNRLVKDITFEVTNLPESENINKQAFQHLGFEIDTRDIHLRSGTVAAHYRRAKRRATSHPTKRNKKRTNRRARHWQYVLHSKEKLQSKRMDRQVHKLLKRAKSFKP